MSFPCCLPCHPDSVTAALGATAPCTPEVTWDIETGSADSGLCQSQVQTVEGTSYTEEQDTVPAPSLSCPLKAV